jgi:hypothetical protein
MSAGDRTGDYAAAWRGRLAVLRHADDLSRALDTRATAASCTNASAGSCVLPKTQAAFRATAPARRDKGA